MSLSGFQFHFPGAGGSGSGKGAGHARAQRANVTTFPLLDVQPPTSLAYWLDYVPVQTTYHTKTRHSATLLHSVNKLQPTLPSQAQSNL